MRDRNLPSFVKEEDGAIAAIYALALVGLVTVAGVGFDYARMAGMHSELQNAADQAALAGASQLDKTTGACSRAAVAAATLLTNESLLGKVENSSLAVTVASGGLDAEKVCDATGKIRFWQNESKTTAATTDANAAFVEVIVDGKTADYALTPIVGLFDSGNIDANATAGVSSAICKVPPLMICMPPTGISSLTKGKGIKATGHSAGGAWGPGDFGFLEVGAGQLADLAKTIAYKDVPYNCVPIDGTRPETGNAQVLFEALNTRFDIYPQGNDAPLNVCQGGVCPPSNNNIKDVIKTSTDTSNANDCRIHNQGWKLPTNRFRPKAKDASDPTPSNTLQDTDGVDAMGYSRDLCHYNSYSGGDCNGDGVIDSADKFGTGNWPRKDYFQYNHGGAMPTGSSSWTRYETYLWEQGLLPGFTKPAAVSSTNGQRQAPLCGVAPSSGTIDRRVLTIAVVTNCGSLAGGSTPVEIGGWYDMFLVEPVVDDTTERANGRDSDMIYVEVIRKSTVGSGSGGIAQPVRRDVPYLVR